MLCFSAFAAVSFSAFWAAFGVVLGCLWAPRVLSGRPGPGIVFSQFFGSPLLRPKWSRGFCPNAQKPMVLGPFLRKGRFAEIARSELHSSQTTCFVLISVHSGGRLLDQNRLCDANFEVSFGVSNVLFRALFGFFLGAPGLAWAFLGSPGLSWPLLGSPGLSWHPLGSLWKPF